MHTNNEEMLLPLWNREKLKYFSDMYLGCSANNEEIEDRSKPLNYVSLILNLKRDLRKKFVFQHTHTHMH